MLDLTKLFNVSSYLYLTSFDIVNGDVCVSTALDIVLYIVIITSFGKSKISSLVVGGVPGRCLLHDDMRRGQQHCHRRDDCEKSEHEQAKPGDKTYLRKSSTTCQVTHELSSAEISNVLPQNNKTSFFGSMSQWIM